MTESSKTGGISPEYAKFLNHYQDFLKHYNCCHEVTVFIQKQDAIKQTYSIELFKEALQEHIDATNSFKKALEAYQEFRQKVLTDLFNKIY